jgi:NADH-quinone oxidoreductase subunit L
VFVTFGTLNFQEVAAAVSIYGPEASVGVLTVATLLLFLGATGKSAQIPLYVWLPDAMEGPTPVSALIHAATMVTAGVYMIGRNAELFSHAPITLAVVAAIGTATALMAGTIGLVQNDIKRVLAYSTVSQLGYMFLAMGVGAYAAGIFHLYTHAFFKALLFLGSGAVIHALAGEQDLRNMGGLKKHLPITYWTFLIGAIAIAGVPPLAGFFSKDEILWKTYSAHWPSYHFLLYVVGLLTALLTATYMFRLVFLAFHGERRHDAPPEHPEEEEPVASDGSTSHASPSHASPRQVSTSHVSTSHSAHGTSEPHLHDAPPAMAFALIVLALGSVVAGWVGVPHAIGGSNRIETFLHESFLPPGGSHEPGSPAEGAPAAAAEGQAAGEATHAAETSTELMLMGISTGLALAGIGLAMYFWLRNRPAADAMARRFSGLHRLLLNKYYVDEIYDAAIVQPVRIVSTGALWKGMDAAGIDGAVNGVGIGIREGSSLLRRLQTGSIRAYAASLFLGVVFILGYYLWR